MRIRRVMLVVALLLLLTAGVTYAAVSGGLEPANPPGSTSSYTLADIYARLTTGAAGTQSTFTEPVSGPTAGTMQTLDTIMGAAPELDDANGATAADVASGKTYWGLKSGGGWGPQTGAYSPAPSAPCDCAGGTLNGTRWCDNGTTVTDLLGGPADAADPTIVGQCLEWAKNASWGGLKPWRVTSDYDDAHARASAYGGETDNWRLPTRAELYALTHGTEAVRSSTMRAFTGVRPYGYWSSTSYAVTPSNAWYVSLGYGYVISNYKTSNFYVWPVRGGQ